MGRAKETSGKKEVRNKKAKKRKEKEQRRLAKKEKSKQSLDDMIAYVDENGVVITSTPQDLTKKKEIDADNIEISIPKKEFREDNKLRQGMITKFDDSKGYGFIADSLTKDSIFIHINDCDEIVKSGDKVEFETEKGFKGLKAKNVKLMKK